jgi:two-component system, NtrC family, sensor kinase
MSTARKKTVRKKPVRRKDSKKWNPASVSEENLQRLDRLANLGTLSAGIAHEIKNGLTAIKTFTELMMQQSEERELVEVVGRELTRIDSMVSQMLRFAALKPALYSSVRVHDVLEHSLRLLQHQVGAKMISVKRDYRAVSHAVHGDEAQLQQVFMNLLFNALEAMGMNGTLTVSTEVVNAKGARCLKIQIHDTGVGISKENLARLFEPFFTTKKNGTGLGLAISQRIVSEHQGRIEVRSEIRRGSKFAIFIPVA